MIDREILDNVLKHITNTASKIILTGFAELDEKFKNVDYGNLIIMAGVPAIGHSSLLISIMYNLLLQNKKCMFCSMNINTETLIRKLIIGKTSIASLHLINSESLNCEELENIKHIIDEIAKLKLTVIDNITSINDIKENIIKNKPEFVFIDSIQLLCEYNQQFRTKDDINIFVELKRIAQENNCVIFNSCNLPDSIDDREDKRPILSDLRQTYFADIFSDTVLFVYRENYYISDNLSDLAEIIIAKNNNGECGLIHLSNFFKIDETLLIQGG